MKIKYKKISLYNPILFLVNTVINPKRIKQKGTTIYGCSLSIPIIPVGNRTEKLNTWQTLLKKISGWAVDMKS